MNVAFRNTVGPAVRTISLALGSALALLCVGVAVGHEGHAPLPSKGLVVDQEKGLIVLSADSREALALTTGEAAMRPLAEHVLAYATLETPWSSHAFATTRIAGRIAQLHVRPGERVQSGQSLATVESLELKNLEVELINARSQAELSERSLAQIEPLVQRQVVPGKQLREARATHRQNLNSLQIAETKLASLGLSSAEIAVIEGGRSGGVGTIDVVSPISGTVMHTDLAVGRVVDPTEHLMEIIDLATSWIRVGVLERDLERVRIGQPLTLTLVAFPDEPVTAAVTAMSRTLEPGTGLATVWAELQNPAGQEPKYLRGMQGHVEIDVSGGLQRLAVPAASLISDGAERFVLVEEASTARATELRRQYVVVERVMGSTAYLRGGDVFPEDRVVVHGSRELGTSFVQGTLRLSAEAERNIGLKLAPVGEAAVERVISLDGRVELPPEGRAFASTQVAGTLLSISVDRGQSVRAGDVLAEVSSVELQDLQLQMIAAQLEVELLDETLASYRELTNEQLLSNRKLWDAETRRAVAATNRDSASAKLESMGVAPELIEETLATRRPVPALSIRAPIDGVIVQFDRAIGQAVPVDEPIFEIHDPSRAIVEGFLSESDIAAIRIGQTARVRLTADPAYLGTGTVERSGRAFGAENRTLSVWVELNDLPEVGLQQGMLARLTLLLDEPAPTLALPADALFREGTQSFAFVQKADGTFERRRVEVGRRSDLYAQITTGLNAGEIIAVSGVESLRTAYAAVR